MIRKTALASGLFAVLASVAALPAQAFDGAAEKARVDALVAKDYPRIDSLYKDIHQHPELGFQETRTAALLAREMRALGFTVTEKVGGTGLVALYRNGPGPVVMVRTELDALPMEEKTGLPYASKAQAEWKGRPTYVMHSCGHDSHMAAWVGAARALVALKKDWSGTLMFIAQPAEEIVSGAKAMLADGLFRTFGKPDYGFALHVSPEPYGTIRVKAGTLSSAADNLQITFKGRGGHGSMPSATIDPIVIGSHFVTDVQTVISREKDAGTFGVITVGSFQSGTVGNIIPDTAILRLTLRSHTEEVRALLRNGVERTAAASAAMAMAPAPEITVESGASAVVNDDKLVSRTTEVLKAAFGEAVEFQPASVAPQSGSEDYSEFIAAGVPSVFFSIGGYDPKRVAEAKASKTPLPVNHSPYFAPVPEPTLKTGVTAMTLAVMNVLQPAPAPKH